ncbi:MAG TPA: VOC family protein, partial [Candidatus Limnocylindrales bacterium]|nr:VOC family protein [Candidatus Limnocylindrales bacterium]
MITGIDHLVIAVEDPDAAAETMEADLGLAVTGGGRHEGAGTYNRLAFLGETYLELIGVYDRAMVAASPAF